MRGQEEDEHTQQGNDCHHQTNDDLAGEGDTEGIQRDRRQYNRASRHMNGQTWDELCGVMSEGKGYDAKAHDPLTHVAAAGDKGERVVMERSCPDERAALPGEIDAELCATDTGRQAHQSARHHCQQQRAPCLGGGRTQRAKNTRANNHAGSHQRSCGASKRARRRTSRTAR